MNDLSFDIIQQIGERARLVDFLDHPWKEIPPPPMDLPTFYLECCQEICGHNKKEEYNVCCRKFYIEDLGEWIYVGACRMCGRVFWSRQHDIYAKWTGRV